jgi:phytoene dehydrogenase-like protein
MDTVLPGPAWRWNEANAQRLRHAFAARLEALGAKGVEGCIGEERLVAPREGEQPIHLAAAPRAWMRRAPNAWPDIAGLHHAGPDAHPGPTTSLRALAGALAAEAAADGTRQ